MSIFMGLEIGKRAVMMNQSVLNITGHNIANANTEGYTRQVAEIVTTTPWYTPALNSDAKPGQFGTGVDIAKINRIRDAFVDAQIRNESKASGYWEAVQTGLDKIEVILNEPSNDGLRSVMDLYWQSWQDLSANPESEAVRAVVAERGMALADTFQHMYRQLTELREDVNANVKVCVDQINSIALQLRDLNQQILSVSIAGKQPNDLLDKRDLLLDQLSQLADTKINIDSKNMVTVQLGGRTLVEGVSYNQLTVQADENGMYLVKWADTGVKAVIDSGQLRGLLDLRGQTELSQEKTPSEYSETIPNLISQLNTLAKTIVIKTNELHKQGYSLNNKTSQPDNIDFFKMPDEPVDSYDFWARDITVNSLIINDSKNIAAAAAPTWNTDGTKSNFGDGANALAIAQLKQSLNSDVLAVTTGTKKLSDLQGKNLSFSIEYAGQVYKVQYTVAAGDDWADIRDGIQTAIDNNSILNGKLTVAIPNAAGTEASFTFTSADGKFTGIKDFINQGEDYKTLMVKDATTDDYWRSLAGVIGVKSQEAQRMVMNQTNLISELENKRQNLSGVSLDEEMTNMIKFQQAYNAAARHITVIDEELDVLINRMGLVGR
jgi:flagellar hook-associated protein 1 FlgK